MVWGGFPEVGSGAQALLHGEHPLFSGQVDVLPHTLAGLGNGVDASYLLELVHRPCCELFIAQALVLGAIVIDAPFTHHSH